MCHKNTKHDDLFIEKERLGYLIEKNRVMVRVRARARARARVRAVPGSLDMLSVQGAERKLAIRVKEWGQ